MPPVLKTYEDFAAYLDGIGFMPLSNNPLGFPSLSALTPPELWHTGLHTDPWQWKSRIVEESRAAYAKLIHGLPSFVSREWYPPLLAVRRGGRTFDDLWEMGEISAEARRIYDLFQNRTTLAVHEIKRMGGFSKTSQGKYESAMKALQIGMFITVSGMARMTTIDGRPHSWPVTEYQRVEDWAWPGVLDEACTIGREAAIQALTAKILQVLPAANSRLIERFLDV